MEEYINRYKALKIYIRLLIILVVAVAPGAYEYMDQSTILEGDLEVAQNEKEAAKRSFDKARRRKSNLPKIEEQLIETEEQLKEASKRLPDSFVMDRILQKTAVIAQEVGVTMLLFDPQEAIPSNTAFRYATLPIKLELQGTYAQIATFFDQIVHLELLVHIRNFRLGAIEQSETKKAGDKSLKEDASKDPGQLQKIKRSRTRIRVEAELVVYRTLTVSEQAAIDRATGADKKRASLKSSHPNQAWKL